RRVATDSPPDRDQRLEDRHLALADPAGGVQIDWNLLDGHTECAQLREQLRLAREASLLDQLVAIAREAGSQGRVALAPEEGGNRARVERQQTPDGDAGADREHPARATDVDHRA